MVSVIIPVYNKEKYLHNCIKAILNQTYLDFELLLINDGSTDSSGKICDEYADKYEKIKVFHSENKGPSSARNIGIRNATADYLTFIDADDIVNETYLKDFLENSEDSDMIIQGLVQKKSDNNETKVRNNNYELNIKNNEDYLLVINESNLISWGYSVAILYKRSIVLTNNILFEEKIKKAEDLIFVLNYLLCSTKIKALDICSYKYDWSITDSLSKKTQSEETVFGILKHLNELLYERLNYNNLNYPNIRTAVLHKFYAGVYDLFFFSDSSIEKINFLESINPIILKNFFTNSSYSFKQEFIHWLIRNRYFKFYLFIYKLKRK